MPVAALPIRQRRAILTVGSLVMCTLRLVLQDQVAVSYSIIMDPSGFLRTTNGRDGMLNERAIGTSTLPGSGTPGKHDGWFGLSVALRGGSAGRAAAGGGGGGILS